jgi:simple sugar transport system substrate-binding protein
MNASRTKRFLSATIALSLAAPLALASTGAVTAQDDAQFCSDTNIVFFPGGPEGGGFATVVFNGAKAAEALFGANVVYSWSDWDPAKMITQFGEAVATQPDGIAVMGHPGDDAFKPLIDDAVSQGIVVTVMNTELAATQAEHAPGGTGYVGAVLYTAGHDLAVEAIKRGGLVEGDQAFLWGLLSQAGRGERTQGVKDGLEEAGIEVIYLEIDDATNADPASGIATFTGMASANPDLKAAFFDHGNLTSTAQSYLEAAGLGPDDLYVAGFDLSPATVAAVQSGFTDLVIDQQQWLQGFEAVAQICLSANYGFSGLNINTGGGFLDASNVDLIAPLVEQQIR